MEPDYIIVTELSRKLGYSGICPESMAALRGLNMCGFLSGDDQRAFAGVMADMESFFAEPDR
jgi:hypothetical protein